MNNNFYIAVLSTALLSTMLNSASAAPPASCASKFVGDWSYPGGTTRVNPDGTANPVCAFCVTVQTWTCSGDTYIITAPSSYTSKLSADGRYLVGDVITAVRVGGASVTSKAPADGAEKKTPSDTKLAKQLERHKLAARGYFRNAKNYEKAARANKNKLDIESLLSRAEDAYLLAAISFDKAKDPANQKDAIAQANRIKALYGQITLVQPSKASSSKSGGKLSPAQCKKLKDQISAIKENGGDTTALEGQSSAACK